MKRGLNTKIEQPTHNLIFKPEGLLALEEFTRPPVILYQEK